MCDALLAVDQQTQAARPHRREVGPAGEECDLLAGARQLDPKMAADGAGPVDANLHRPVSLRLLGEALASPPL